jgi:3-methyladenine DNA glycosylase/8-oxoguanine DNA glycosylase
VPVKTILWPLRRGTGDPAFRVVGGDVWRTARTPNGPVTLQITSNAATGEVTGRGWGPGASWALAALPAMLGDTDDAADEFAALHVARHPFLRHAHRTHPHWRVPRTGLVHEALLAAVLEQKVTGQEAWAGWRTLLRRFGDPAPGPGEMLGLRVLPAPETVCRIPSWEWLRFPVDPARSRAAIAASKLAASLERTLSLPGPDAERALCSVPGIGVWTAAEVRQRAHGDADAVSFGDYHVPGMIGHTLTGTPTTDAEVAGLLEPFRPHRYRVQRLVELCGTRPPRRGPRMAPRRHLPGRYR